MEGKSFYPRLIPAQEVKALEDLANALQIIAKKKALGYLKGEIIKRTILAGVFAPTWWLQFGQIIGARPAVQ